MMKILVKSNFIGMGQGLVSLAVLGVIIVVIDILWCGTEMAFHTEP
jgi:hypothetical protein